MKNLWQRFSKRERALVVLSAVILVALLGKYLVIAPYIAHRTWVKAQLESLPLLLTKNRRYLGQKDSMLAALEAARTEIKAREPKLLTGDTPSVSASDLQETVQALAGREGTQVITTRVLNPEPAGSFSKIGIQMEIGGQIQQIANLIKGIDTSPKLLVIDEINIRSLFRPIGFPQAPGLPQLPAQNLRVSLTVAGFARAQAPAAGKAESPGNSPKSAPDRGV